MNKIIPVLGGILVGLSVGFVVGKKVTLNRLEKDYSEALDKEIAETKALLNTKHKEEIANRRVPGFSIPREMLGEVEEKASNFDNSTETLERVVKGLRYGPSGLSVAPAKPAMKSGNIWRDRDKPYFNLSPYIIPESVYMEGDKNYTQITITYYAADDTLADENDNLMDDILESVGEINVESFGESSDEDPNVVYVRNENLEIDYEIILNTGSYKEIVAGLGSDD